ncbi:peptidase inhibitor family I36 protein [Streptomyces sp. NPDC020965]|uniref:peptidase inhibitor family I36 protein n=1 Tax=Streptomyces sp. NPDC020965 TaxID=3365105 RepID=UPI0037BCABEA
MRRFTSLAVASIALTAAFTAAPTATAEPKTVAYPSCGGGQFCIYSDWNGTGEVCASSARSVSNTADYCGFIQRGQTVKSVWNFSGHRKQYYTQPNHQSRVGSTLNNQGGNLQGGYQIRSFKPQ